jgi:TolA-binding protein
MFASSGLFRRGSWTGFGLAIALVAWIVGGETAMAQAPKPEPAKATQENKPAESRRGDPGLDQKINQAREEIELLELHLQTRKAQLQLAEARLAEARRWKALFEELFRGGFAGEERYLAARDDVLMHESRMTAEKAGVQEAELRVKQAKRRLDYGEFSSAPQEYRIDELEQRLGSLEKSIDRLQPEVGNLERMVRHQWKMPDNVERPAVGIPR